MSGFGADQTANYNSLLSAGRLDEAQKYQKTNADIGKIGADTKESEAKTKEVHLRAVNLKLGQAKDLINTIQSPEQAALWVQQMYKDPDLSQVFSASGDTPEAAIGRIPRDPRAFADWKMQASLGADKLIEYTKPNANTVANNQTSILTNKLTNDTSRANNAANNAVSIRGQNMTDARTREAASAGKIPTGYRANKDGSLSFIPGGPADPNTKDGKMTEDQAKATGWLIQAENAYGNMKKVTFGEDGKLAKSAKPGIGDALAEIPFMGGLGNRLRSDDRQKFVQGASSLSESLLRAATGAGVNISEAKQKIEEITPVFGDSDAVIKQKFDAIPLYLDSLRVRSGAGAKKAAGVLASKQPANDVFSAADAILKGGK